MSHEDQLRAGRRKFWRPIAVLGVVVALLGVYALFGKQVQGALESARGWIESTGPWAPVVFALVYIVGVVVCFPGTVLTLAAGAMFGPVKGLMLVSLASTAGASCSFLIARYFAREPVARWLERKEKFRRLDELTREQGGIVVAIARLVPLFPFTLINYGFGLTGVRFPTYVVYSWLFMLPGTAAFVLGGAAVATAAEERKFPWGIFVALLAAVVVVFIAGQLGHSYLRHKMGYTDGREPQSNDAAR